MYKIVYSEVKHSDRNDSLLFLPEEVRDHIANIKDFHRKEESIVAWSLLNMLVKDTFCKELIEYSFRYNQNGKPEFEEFFVSLSHSKGAVCVAIADYEIGVDIEKIRKLHYQKQLKKKCCQNHQISNEDFFLYFARREAYMKAKGEKLGLFKNNLDSDEETIASIVLQIQNEKYALAYYPKASEVEIMKK